MKSRVQMLCVIYMGVYMIEVEWDVCHFPFLHHIGGKRTFCTLAEHLKGTSSFNHSAFDEVQHVGVARSAGVRLIW